MKNIIWAVAALIIAGGLILEGRYMLVVNSPIVVKLDRFTGDTWIVNSGVWRKIEVVSPEAKQAEKALPAKPAAKAK